MNYTLFALAALVALVSAAPGPDVWVKKDDYKVCKEYEKAAQIELVEVKNYPLPTSALDVTVHTRGKSATRVMPGAKVTLTAKLGFIPLNTVVIDVCDALKANGADCPMDADKMMDLFITTPVPHTLPIPANVNINVRALAKNPDGSVIFCVDNPVYFV